jgi:mannose-6-phosphate isomerase|tara:strand:+ start:14227 stop:14592 length:366 start_codon:yes stop_codon:yes gene_type:complete
MKRNSFLKIDSELRPWGQYFVIHDEEDYKLKRIHVNPHQRLSYQYHNKRSETWVIISGKAIVTINGISKEYYESDTIVIPLKAKHRIENNSNETLVFIEVQCGDYFGEDDIVRIEDDYRRK